MQRFDPLSLLEFREFGRIGESEKCGSKLDQPLGVDGGDLSHVLFCGLDNLVEDDPLRLTVEQGTAWMNGNHLEQENISYFTGTTVHLQTF